jgi:hypothetical protein
MPLTKEQMRVYMKDRRLKEKAARKLEQPTETDEAHPVYPQLKRYSDRSYDEGGLVLFSQHCELCKGTWSASINIPCPYCRGTGTRLTR